MKIFNYSEGKFVANSPWLTIGKEYVVLQILCCTEKGVLYRLISDDVEGSPAIFSANQFQITSLTKPSNWEVTIKKNNFIIIGPAAWSKNGFWEECYDGDHNALEIYKREARIIMSDENIL